MFREKIDLFVPEPEAKLYIPKNNGLHKYVNDLLDEIGVRDGGEFTRTNEDVGALEIISARGEDVPQRVEDCLLRGESAYGLTGDDLFDEYMLGTDDSELQVLNTYDWFDPNAQFQRPALCLLNPKGKIPDSPTKVSIAVNKKYELTSHQYLSQRSHDSNLQVISIVAYAGDTEDTVAEGTHDGCVEVVYRGESSPKSAISKAGLKIAEVVRFTDISLIGQIKS